MVLFFLFFFFQAEDGIRDTSVTGVQTCALPIYGKQRGNILGDYFDRQALPVPSAKTCGEGKDRQSKFCQRGAGVSTPLCECWTWTARRPCNRLRADLSNVAGAGRKPRLH